MNPTPGRSEAARAVEIGQLIEQLSQANERLAELLGSDVDRVTAANGKSYLLQQAQPDSLPIPPADPQTIFSALPANVVLLDQTGMIVDVNTAWKRYAAANGMQTPAYAMGTSYLTVCDVAAGQGDPVAAQVAQGLRRLLSGTSKTFEVEYPCHSPEQDFWYLLRAAAVNGGRGVVVVHDDITPSVIAKHALDALSQKTRKSERLLKAALSAISDFTYIIDPRGRLLFANQRVLDLWGVSLEQAIGMDAHDLLGYPAESAQRIKLQLESVFATGQPVADELAYVNPAGAAGYYAYTFEPAFCEQGSVEFVVGCTTDITQRKRYELAQQESAAEFRTLAAAMPQIVFVTDAQRQATYLNQQWVDYTGIGLALALDDGWKAAVHPDDWQDIGDAFEQAHGNAYSCEVRLRRIDGVYRWWLVRASAMVDSEGAVLKWIGTSTDIHDLRTAQLEITRANEELRRQRAELRLVLDLVPARIWFRDTRGKILRVNEQGAKSVGRTVAELEGALLEQVYPLELARQYRASDTRIVRTGEPILGVLERYQAEDGSESWTQLDKVPFRDDSGKVVGIVVMRQDITERKRDQDALRELNAELEERVRRRTAQLDVALGDAERANRAKSEFLAMMSHEIRTPMSGLLGMLELHALSLDPTQKSTLAVARTSAQSLMRIIDDILDFSKIEASSMELHLAAGSIRTVVNNICRLHTQVASSKNLALQVDIAPEIGACHAFDALRLGQILNNFINNAIKFTAAGRITVAVGLDSVRADVQALRFEVRDTGIGMTPQQMEKVFLPFVQASAETSARFGGTGLGLSISKRIAELMGGSVAVQSELGVGTRMALLVELAVCTEAVPDASEPPAGDPLETVVAGRRSAPSVAQAEADGSLLLLVDDHPTNRAVLTWQVASLGYASVAVADGAEALQAYGNTPFAAIITDCNMPVMNGYELTRAIRRLEQEEGRKRIPIIACTANALPATAEACLSEGMDACMVKPVDLPRLGTMLDRCVPLPRFGAPGTAEPADPVHALAATGDEDLIDLALIAEICGGDAATQGEMLLDFQRVNDADAVSLGAAVASGDIAQALRFAHRIKGSSQMLGAHALCRVCDRLDAAARAQDAPTLRLLMTDFDAERIRLNRRLARFSQTGD